VLLQQKLLLLLRFQVPLLLHHDQLLIQRDING
jgi:hypothetical protein